LLALLLLLLPVATGSEPRRVKEDSKIEDREEDEDERER
jgi:hypothetical protein